MPRRVPRWPAVGILGSLTLVAGAVLGSALTPHDHVAPGCWWWSARPVSGVTANSRGCVKGYVVVGVWLAEDKSQRNYALYYSFSGPDTPQTRPDCPFRPGDAVVVRYHGIVDDGQTVIVIDDCR